MYAPSRSVHLLQMTATSAMNSLTTATITIWNMLKRKTISKTQSRFTPPSASMTMHGSTTLTSRLTSTMQRVFSSALLNRLKQSTTTRPLRRLWKSSAAQRPQWKLSRKSAIFHRSSPMFLISPRLKNGATPSAFSAPQSRPQTTATKYTRLMLRAMQ